MRIFTADGPAQSDETDMSALGMLVLLFVVPVTAGNVWVWLTRKRPAP